MDQFNLKTGDFEYWQKCKTKKLQRKFRKINILKYSLYELFESLERVLHAFKGKIFPLVPIEGTEDPLDLTH